MGLTAGALLALAILWKVPQWQVGHEGQITARFTKAIEQLGATDATGRNKKTEVRLGGIYALEGIANESKELHWPIMEVLCTYVRMNAPVKPQKSPYRHDASTPYPTLTTDIQAILTVLGRRDRKYEKESQHLDLRNADIQGAQLFGADLNGAVLSGADLNRADLSRADLNGAELTAAYLGGARLIEAQLIKATLNGADLSRAALDGAQLSGAYLNGADLDGAALNGAHLDRTVLNGAHLDRAVLIGTYLNGAYLIKAQLNSAYLAGAILRGADLSEADLSMAHFNGADLRGTKGLVQEQVDSAYGDSHTELPENLHMPDSWKK